jgi:hypothetical protein
MNCKKARKRLVRGASRGAHPALLSHLESCPSCGSFAARLAEARQALKDHWHVHEPPASFARRVVANLPRRQADPFDVLGWAAVRLLPATLLLLVLLGSWSLVAAPSPTDLLADGGSQDVLTWVWESQDGLQ